MNFARPTSSRPIRWMLAAVLFPARAFAHPGHYHPGEEDEFDSLAAGFMHPLDGLDHMLIALAAGWLAFAWLGGKSRAISLASFLGALGIGALIGRGLQAANGLEIAISLTLMLAGLAFVLGKSPAAPAFTAALAGAGLIHGFAHGAEAANSVVFPLYAAGFLCGTAILLMAGGGLHLAISKVRQPLIPRAAGLALLGLGSMSLVQSL